MRQIKLINMKRR
jgi:predicted RNA-binding protein YlqC (UPF0109 family)